MMKFLHQRVKRLDYWDLKMLGVGSFFLGFLVARFIPELIDVNPWWWGTVAVLLFLRPLYHFFIHPSSS